MITGSKHRRVKYKKYLWGCGWLGIKPRNPISFWISQYRRTKKTESTKAGGKIDENSLYKTGH